MRLKLGRVIENLALLFARLHTDYRAAGAVSSASDCHSGGREFAPRADHITFTEIGSINNFCGHSLTPAYSIRTVVSYWQKNVH